MGVWEQTVKDELSKHGYSFKRLGKRGFEVWGNDAGVAILVAHVVNKEMVNALLAKVGIAKRY
jgi:hypothetical protein